MPPPLQSITIRVLINQNWDQDWEWNKGFKQKKYSFLIANLHLLLDILQHPLPDTITLNRCTTNLCCKRTKKRTDRISNGEITFFFVKNRLIIGDLAVTKE